VNRGKRAPGNAHIGRQRRNIPLPCHEYSAERHSHRDRAESVGGGGTNENTNGLVREYFPKGTDITGDIRYLNAVADEINGRPRAMLGFRTPAEVFAELLLADNPDGSLSSIASTG